MSCMSCMSCGSVASVTNFRRGLVNSEVEPQTVEQEDTDTIFDFKVPRAKF